MNPASSSPADLEMARSIARRILAGSGAKATLFGSRARGGDARMWSDIDLAVECAESTSRIVLAELREAYEESNLLLNVDVVDLRDASAEIRAAVQREGVPWID